jgi:hypothetical protein
MRHLRRLRQSGEAPKRTLKLYSPHPKQLELHNSTKRYRIGLFGRQSGKSTFANNELLKTAWESVGTNHWFLSPTFAQCKVQYRRMVGSLLNCPEAMLSRHKSDLRLKLLSQSAIAYKSGDNFENLRGETLNSAIIDEVRDQDPKLWPMIIRPMLSTTKGRASFISTPNGYDFFYDLYLFAKEHPDDWDVVTAPSTANPLFTLKEYEDARATMTDKQFRQEILAEFLDLTAGKAYYAFNDDNINERPFWGTAPETWISPHRTIVIGMDFNLNPMSWTLGQTNLQQWYWAKEVYLENSNTVEASIALCELLESYRSKGWLRADPQLLIVGDAAGKASQRAAASKSDYDIVLGMLRDRGYTFDDQTPESNPLVKDRVNAVNAKLRTADGTSLMRISPTGCPRLIRDLQRVTWKEGAVILDKTRDASLTHASDSIGYAIHKITPIKQVTEVGVPKVVIF